MDGIPLPQALVDQARAFESGEAVPAEPRHAATVVLLRDGEPAVAPHIPCAFAAGHAHARLDSWAEALPWLLETVHGRGP